MSKHALKQAIAVVGSQSELARLVGVKQAHVWNWLNRDDKVPADVCPAIERATAGKIRCESLRPDVDWAYLRIPSEQRNPDAVGCP